jgi:hypothetical protein
MVTTHAQDHNDYADAINKIETELGADPSGVKVSVAARLNDLFTDNNLWDGEQQIWRETADATHAMRFLLDGAVKMIIGKGGDLYWDSPTTANMDARLSHSVAEKKMTFEFGSNTELGTVDTGTVSFMSLGTAGYLKGGAIEIKGTSSDKLMTIAGYQFGWAIFCEPAATDPPGETQAFLEIYTPWGVSCASSTNDRDQMLLVRDQADSADVSLQFDFTGHTPAYGKLQVGNFGSPLNGKDIGLKFVTNNDTAGTAALVTAMTIESSGEANLHFRAKAALGIEFAEQTAPSAVANKAVLFAKDNGSGKTQLMVQFPTGSPVQLAIEP